MAAVSPIQQLRDIESKSLSKQSLATIEQQQAHEWRGVGFRVGDIELVASMDTIVEALEPIKCTRVPSAKSWFDGIANVRGQLVPVSDLYGFLYGERPPADRNTRLLVFRLANTVAGLAVTAVTGIRTFAENTMDNDIPDLDERIKPFVTGCFHRSGEDYPVFDFNRLVSNERFMHIMEAAE
jgi:twitching motility protein PilI